MSVRVFHNENLTPINPKDMYTGMEVFINTQHEPEFGEVYGFFTLPTGRLGIEVKNEKGEIRKLNSEWIYYHPYIIDRTPEYFAFSGEVVLIPHRTRIDRKEIAVICQCGPKEYKLMVFGQTGKYVIPNRSNDIAMCGFKREGYNGIWFSTYELKNHLGLIFNDCKFTGKTLFEYFNDH